MEPIPPMKLITPFACERYFEGVTSGINATTGVRQIAMESMKVMVQVINSGSRASGAIPSKGTATTGAKKKASAAIGAPTSMKGSRRPIFVRVRSESEPITGCSRSAAMLSNVIKKPIWAGFRSKRFARKSGTNELYTAQAIITAKKPNPNKNVFP